MTDDDLSVPYVRQRTRYDPPSRYLHGPDSERQPGVPSGRIEQFEWSESTIYPGTTRTIRIYVPAQYSPGVLAALMVFQDGQLYLDTNLDMRAGVVFDNLIHACEMPTTIGVFVDPGQPGNRNVEYDPADDRYVTFLLTEVIPAIRERFSIADDPESWAICGGSSGGNCAFTAAWQRPDRFSKVLTFVASFAQIPGGNPYPAMIRNSSQKPLRVYMQANARDLNWNEPEQNWFSNNLLVAAALAERSYDHRLVLGDGGHSPNHGGAILPDALRWLWR